MAPVKKPNLAKLAAGLTEKDVQTLAKGVELQSRRDEIDRELAALTGGGKRGRKPGPRKTGAAKGKRGRPPASKAAKRRGPGRPPKAKAAKAVKTATPRKRNPMTPEQRERMLANLARARAAKLRK